MMALCQCRQAHLEDATPVNLGLDAAGRSGIKIPMMPESKL